MFITNFVIFAIINVLHLTQAILEPLSSLAPAPASMLIILVDGLCEAEHHRPDYGHTLASFLAAHALSFPPWLKVGGIFCQNFGRK